MEEATQTHTQTFDRHAPRCLTIAHAQRLLRGAHRPWRGLGTVINSHVHKSTQVPQLYPTHSQNQKRQHSHDMCAHKNPMCTQTNKPTTKPSWTDNSTGSSSSERACPYRLLFQLSGPCTLSNCNPSLTSLFLPAAPRRSL